MKPISQKQWDRYKESQEGKETIAIFEHLLSDAATSEDMLIAAKRFDPQFFQNVSKKEEERMEQLIADLMEDLERIIDSNDLKFETPEDYDMFYVDMLCILTASNKEMGALTFDESEQNRFKDILSLNLFLSTVLFSYLPAGFIPNYFPMQFMYLQMIADKYEIELPKVPNRSDYKGRNLYYLEMLYAMVGLANDYGIVKPAEVCAFIYGYELELAKEEFEYAHRNDELPKEPVQAWLLVGNISEGEKNMDFGFWQANDQTSKGDIMIFYEKSPVKAMNAIWIAQTDGVVDPFFYYFSNTYIGDKIAIPADKAITFEEFKANEYFQKKGEKVVLNKDKTPKIGKDGKPVVTHEGNYVAKNFQDCSGWIVTRDDYAEIKRMLEAKGFDTSVLPTLYQPKKIGDIVITVESDVTNCLLLPLLDQMGYEYTKEVEFRAGHTTTGYGSDKRPDVCLGVRYVNGVADEARIVIEVKKLMKNAKEIHEAFLQGLSYAKWGAAQVFAICDERQIRVYLPNAKGKFNEKDFVKFSWADTEDGDKYVQLKKLWS